MLGREGISSIHIVSHGQSGELDFGASKLNLSDLSNFASQIRSWSNALTEDADLLLYGCNVAAGELGKAFVKSLSQLTGADVAASDDRTGSAAKGGDWALEYETGNIETALAFSPAATLGYEGVLDDAVYAAAVQFTSGEVTAQKVVTDGSGNVYTTGSFKGTVDFNPGTGIANLTSAGGTDAFISKLDSSGNYLWVKQLGGMGDDVASGISVDSSGNVYTTGTFYGTADFDPGAGIANLMAGGATNSFISKLSQTSPHLTVSATPLGYTENDPATLIDATATIEDPDSTDFDTGTLTVSYSANGTADDRLAIRNQGTSSGQIGVSVSTVTYSGTLTGGTGTAALVITFNASATAIAVTALLQNLTYANVSDYPSTAARTVQFVMTDGDGFTSSAVTKTINVTAVNDNPVNLLWRSNNPATPSSRTGQNAIWQLNSFTLESGYYLPTVTDSNWQIVSTADFNHDGTDDLLWRNQATGQNAIWQLNSAGFQSSRFITPIADLNWKIVSTADFDRDGIADILWRNQASGQNAIWQMNSTDVQTGYYLTPIADFNWQIISTADFNNDGIADILWRNQATGQNAIWQMKSDFTLQSGRFITSIANSNWQIVGTGDFNDDGIADLMWRNQATGQNAIWQMNSTDVQTGYYLTPVADMNWQIAGIADFDGDGSPDLLWRNAQASKVGIWQMNGFTESQAYLLPDVPFDWVGRSLRAPKASVNA